MAGPTIADAVADESAFGNAEFLGLSRTSKRDPYRLGLFARHLEIDERANAFLPISGGTLVVTDQRLIYFTTHLEVDGAWNVREFQGYVVSREMPLEDIQEVHSSTSKAGREIVDTLHVATAKGQIAFVISRGPERIVSEEDVATLLGLLMRHSPSHG